MIIVNFKTDSYDVYIGRPGRGKKGYFGNPFPLNNPFRQDEREKVIARFSHWFEERVSKDVEYAQKVLDLRGKRCGCFCKPLSCHGDIMAKWVNSITCNQCEELATKALLNDNEQVELFCDQHPLKEKSAGEEINEESRR